DSPHPEAKDPVDGADPEPPGRGPDAPAPAGPDHGGPAPSPGAGASPEARGRATDRARRAGAGGPQGDPGTGRGAIRRGHRQTLGPDDGPGVAARFVPARPAGPGRAARRRGPGAGPRGPREFRERGPDGGLAT